MISIIIPSYNEEERIGVSLEKIINYFKSENINAEILVVDDGSKDKTSEIASKFPEVRVIKQDRNRGKGAAVRRGMLEAKGDFCVFSDADLSTPIYEIKKLIEQYQNGYDVCIGSRAVDYSMIKEHQPWYREMMGKTFNKIVQLLVVRGIKDTQCGFKGFKKEAAKNIFSKQKIDGFAFDVELVFLAGKLNYKIIEIPVEWYNDERSKVNPITDSTKMFLEILKIRRIHRDL
jgi:dolichyl-phosphate beta-glucosyltransferase